MNLQIRRFRTTILEADGTLLTENFRPVQPLNSRPIYTAGCFTPSPPTPVPVPAPVPVAPAPVPPPVPVAPVPIPPVPVSQDTF